MEKVQKVYIGSTSNQGIAEYDFQNGELIRRKWTKDERRCTYLAKTDSHLYGVIEIEQDELQEGGYIVSYQIEENGLKKIEKKPSSGKGPCHITVDKQKKVMSISHYIDGTFCVRKIQEDGKIGEIIFQEKNIHSHLHCSKFYEKYLLKVDLGKDAIVAYQLQENEIQKKAEYQFERGSQPRHLVIEQDQVYVITEKSCQLYELQFKEEKFSLKNQYSLLPEGEEKGEMDTGCAIQLSQDRKNLYTTLRGKNFVCVFRKKDTGWEMIQTIPSGGKMPWDLAVDDQDQFVLVANLDSSRITIFSRNQEDGRLTYFGEEAVESPTCILF